MVEVTTVVEPDPAGQSVTVGAQLVIVIKLVVNTVDVVIRRGVLTAEVVVGTTTVSGTETEGTAEPGPTDTDICSYRALRTGAVVEMANAVVVEPGVQSKLTLYMPKPQLSYSLSSGSSKRTDLAPPHWSLVTTVPAELQEAVFLQVDPSGML